MSSHSFKSTKTETIESSTFFQLTFVVSVVGLPPGSVVLNRRLLLILIYSPLLHPHTLESLQSLCCSWVCVCACVCMGLHAWRWCQLYSVSKDRCAEDRLSWVQTQSRVTLCSAAQEIPFVCGDCQLIPLTPVCCTESLQVKQGTPCWKVGAEMPVPCRLHVEVCLHKKVKLV